MASFYPHGVLPVMSSGRPITIDEACSLKLLLFGDTEKSFDDNWTKQDFHFRSVPPYGLSQKRGGPCGVLAGVQAHIIREIFFGLPPISGTSNLKLKAEEKKYALSLAVGEILWRAGGYKSTIVCVKKKRIMFEDDTSEAHLILKKDGLIEHVFLIYFECKDCLLQYLRNVTYQITKGEDCILFLYSVLLSKGIDNIKNEMDVPESNLIGEDGYCSQEIVNLILIGKAVPNLFDGDIELNSGGDETTLHHGIPKQSQIGLLSLYDYEDTSPVGKHYKEPVYPIWVLIGDNHFSVLFAKSRLLISQRPKDYFTLYHYDGLANHHAETAYLIKPFNNSSEPAKDKKLPVAVRCIYSRWPLASIEKQS